MGGKASRDKGKVFERKIANLLKRIFPEAERGDSQSKGARQADVEGTPFWIECKKAKKLRSTQEAMRQADKDTDGRPTVVIAQQDREALLVTMHFDDWMVLVERATQELPIGPREHICDSPCGICEMAFGDLPRPGEDHDSD